MKTKTIRSQPINSEPAAPTPALFQLAPGPTRPTPAPPVPVPAGNLPHKRRRRSKLDILCPTCHSVEVLVTQTRTHEGNTHPRFLRIRFLKCTHCQSTFKDSCHLI